MRGWIVIGGAAVPAENRRRRWGVILAGGDGTRLRSLTRAIAGDDRPKQFCPVLGGETLLEQTRRRVALGISPDRMSVVVTRRHARFYGPLLADLWAPHVVVQPDNRGTAPAILLALLRVAAVAPGSLVAVFPSDHYVSSDAVFMAQVEQAFAAADACPERVVLLGVAPDRPETEYGWIEPEGRLHTAGSIPVHGVRRFWEKPAPSLAAALLERGCLWNSFVMVGRLEAFLDLLGATLPGLTAAFAPVEQELGGAEEGDALARVYVGLESADFSRAVLARQPGRLAVMPVRGVLWSDLGDPARVRTTRREVELLAAG